MKGTRDVPQKDIATMEILGSLQQLIDKIYDVIKSGGDEDSVKSVIRSELWGLLADEDIDDVINGGRDLSFIDIAGRLLTCTNKAECRALVKYIESLIRKLREAIKTPKRPHLDGYLRFLLSQLYLLLSKAVETEDKLLSARYTVDYLKHKGLTLKIRGLFNHALQCFSRAITITEEMVGLCSAENARCPEDLVTRLNEDLKYLTALQREVEAEIALFQGRPKDAIGLLYEASKLYREAGDDKSGVWCEAFAKALEGVYSILEGDQEKALRLLTTVRNNLYPRIKDAIDSIFERGATLDRIFGATLVRIAGDLADSYRRLLGSALELLLNMYYLAMGYTLLPKVLSIERERKEVDLNAIKI